MSAPNQRVVVTLIDRSRGGGIDRDHLLITLQQYVDRCLAPVWGVAADLRWGSGFEPGAWALVFVDRSKRQSLGYHHLTAQGFPLGVVAVEEARRAGKAVSVLAAHELAEMLVDPTGNLLVRAPTGRVYALEICDPVKEHAFLISDLPVANFVFPAWFHMPGTWRYRAPDGRLDWMGVLRRPFQVHAAGYIPTLVGGRWRKQTAASGA